MVKKRSKISITELALKIDSYRREVVNLNFELQEQINNLEMKINHLPTSEDFYTQMDKLVGELKKLREEQASTQDLYASTNKRVDIIDKTLSIDTSVVF